MLEWLALGLVLTGMVLAIALAVLHWQAQRYARLATALIARRSEVGNDPLAWFEVARPVLARAGVQGLRWEGEWFAAPVAGGWGGPAGATRRRRFDVGDMRLEVAMHLRRAHGEQRLLREALLAVFDLLLEQALLARAEAISAALARQAELSLYLQHDMKNLAQWMLLLADQFEHADERELPELAAQFRGHAPMVRRQAERLVATLARRAPVDPPAVELSLAEEARIYAGFHGVSLEVTGGPDRLRLPRPPLERILDNLFSNFAGNGGTPVSLHLVRDAGCVRAVFRQDTAPALPPVRLFEPLASSRPDGTGLGLHQARLAARGLGGDLVAHCRETGIDFVLTLPAP
ncbi:MAG: sensor histidine kinase [Rehaibacterium terrae]|uniref:sensor histidine kinase n=1 Tax=Rehaibacterium terrae TaxID=1341696 RepID=UPI003918F4FC